MELKNSFKPIDFNNYPDGYNKRKTYYENIFQNGTALPKKLEYSDIDAEMFDFIDKKLKIVCDGKLIPSFKLYSTQRFSEYSQTWNHSDSEGNLLMNFKTINREINPTVGENQDGLFNIPGDRKYPIMVKEVLDNNSTESYEIYSIKQPFAIDLTYSVNFVTNSLNKINEFNIILNELFKSKQYYIFPNGHSIPLLLEDIDDNTEYNIDNRKFFVQSCTITAMAYIIDEKSFSVDRVPKRFSVKITDKINECENEVEITDKNEDSVISIIFNENSNKISFNIDCDAELYKFNLTNVRNFIISINDNEYDSNHNIKVNTNDEICLKINKYNNSEISKIEFFFKKSE